VVFTEKSLDVAAMGLSGPARKCPPYSDMMHKGLARTWKYRKLLFNDEEIRPSDLGLLHAMLPDKNIRCCAILAIVE
jgi:hypothetical protein